MLEKILTPLYVKKKNSITGGLGKVKSLPKPNSPYRPLPPPSKVIWSALIVRASRIVKVLLLLYYLEGDF